MPDNESGSTESAEPIGTAEATQKDNNEEVDTGVTDGKEAPAVEDTKMERKKRGQEIQRPRKHLSEEEARRQGARSTPVSGRWRQRRAARRRRQTRLGAAAASKRRC